MKTILKASAAMVLAVSLTGCHIYKKYETPTDTPLTAAYAEALEAGVDSPALGNLPWEEVFTDPLLVKYINQALENNTNLRNAQLNVEAARAQVLGAKLAYLPSVALAPNGAGAKYGPADFGWSYTLPAQVSWEVDIFAKLLNGSRSAQAALMQTEAYAQAVRSQIISAVATTYYTLGAVSRQLELSRNTSALWAETVQKMRDLKEAGRTTEVGVMQAEANYYSILGSITDLESSVVKLNNTMSLLLNVMPREWEVNAYRDLEIPAFAAGGVEMSMLAARPDVTAAEMSLAQAYYATNSARAAFYPGLTITANGGFTNLLGSMIRNPGDWFVQLAGSLVAPLFSRGRNIAGLRAAKARQQSALNTFEYTLLSAASEVSNALTVYDRSIIKAGFLANQVADLEKAVSMTQALFTYSTGDVDYLQVITAQQGLLGAQISLIDCNRARDLAVINLYQALGGGR
ncbi:MAG: TolC family protein [Muribaculaceae bacterium]|nr:TolC family protein [Muribaculaceae bacterium]